MKKTIEVQGKKVEDAIAEGLKILGMTMDEVDIKIISAGGLFKKAKVELSYGEDEPQAVLAKTETVEDRKEAEKKPEKSFENKQANSNKPIESNKSINTNKPINENKPIDKPAVNKTAGAKIDTVGKPQKSDTSAKPQKQTAVASETDTTVEPVKPDRSNNKQDKQEKPQREREHKNQNGGKQLKKNFDEDRSSAPVSAEQMDTCKTFLENLMAKMGIEGSVLAKEDNGLKMTIDTADSAVIGHRGEVLDALQYLTSLVLNSCGGKDVIFNLDALGYREKRIDTLKKIAERAADKCVRIGKKVSLESMNSSDRRIIHASLSNRDDVFTRSEGHEPARRIAILPIRK